MKALVVGYEEYLSWFLPGLLHRAGFAVDIITRSNLFQSSQCIQKIFSIPSRTLAVTVLLEVLETHDYDWIIITEDSILSEVLSASIPRELKLKILPVTSEKSFSHLSSKIGLSELLSDTNLLTPHYRVARKVKEALSAAETIGYPVLIKIDASGGGAGVYECNNPNDIKKLIFLFTGHAILVQKKIAGRELDLSAIYYRGNLAHFSYSIFCKTAKKFGPSLEREYHHPGTIDLQIYLELQTLGKALGAHGFVNITCMLTPESKRYYIEADMRPNAWIDFSRFIDNDAAPKIHQAFFGQQFLDEPPRQEVKTKKIRHFMTLSFVEILCNRYGAWQSIPYEDKNLIHALLRIKAISQTNSALKKIKNFFLQNAETCIRMLAKTFRNNRREIT